MNHAINLSVALLVVFLASVALEPVLAQTACNPKIETCQ